MKYMVSAIMTVSCYTYVSADSPEQAKELAKERTSSGLCHGACTDDGNEEWIIDDLDGMPNVESVELHEE